MQTAGGPVNETGNYQLGKLLGRGGMGSVFEATHRFLGTSVAVKMLHPQLAEKPEVAQRFFREARAAVEIDHPNIVRVTDFGQARDGALYLVMELLTGRSLARAIATHRFTEAEAARVGAEVASGLEAAHARGIIHRDLKPDNIFLTTTQVKILDFGIAKVLDSLVTTTGGTLGTPLYMDPEQAKDASSCGPHSDIYALGVILFEMLTGRPPFLGDSVPAVLTKHLFAQPPRPSELAPVSGRMEELVLACLEKDPQARPPSMGAIRLVLDELASGLDCATLLGGFPAPELLSALAATLPSPFHDTPPADSAAPSVVEQRASIAASQAPGARSRIWLIGGGLVVIAAASGVGWHLARDRGDEPSSSGRPAAIVAPALPTAQHAPADAGVPVADAPHLATFVVRSQPDGALVSIAGVSVGKTPVSLSVPLPAELWVSLEGHEPLRHVATAPGDVSLTLQRRGRRPGGVGPRVQGTPETVPSERSPRTETLD